MQLNVYLAYTLYNILNTPSIYLLVLLHCTLLIHWNNCTVIYGGEHIFWGLNFVFSFVLLWYFFLFFFFFFWRNRIKNIWIMAYLHKYEPVYTNNLHKILLFIYFCICFWLFYILEDRLLEFYRFPSQVLEHTCCWEYMRGFLYCFRCSLHSLYSLCVISSNCYFCSPFLNATEHILKYCNSC